MFFIQKFNNFPRNSYNYSNLKEGKYNYFGEDIEIHQVRTVLNGLCYKIHFTNPLPKSNFLTIIASTSLSGMDKLAKINLFLAGNETWQGIIDKTWPYSKFPLTVSGQFQTKVMDVQYAYIEENDWKFLEGQGDFDECMDDYQSPKCGSIFDPRPLKNR